MKLHLIAIGIMACSATPILKASTLTIKLSDSIEITATEVRFVPSEHRITGCVPYQNCRVDAVIAVGSIGIPKSSLSKVTVQTGAKKYVLDTSGMFDPLLDASGKGKTFGGFCYDENNCAFRAVLGDAGGSHAAEWVIENGEARRTLLSESQDIVEFFLKHLTPPQYK